MSIVTIREAYLTLIIRFPAVEINTWPECPEENVLHFSFKNTSEVVLLDNKEAFLEG
jgi:hypothetical protein